MNEFENSYTPAPVPAEPPVPTSARVLGYISMGCGIASLCTFFVGIAFASAGLITGSISRRKNYGRATKQARLGKILSIIGIPVSILCIVLYVVVLVELIDGINGGLARDFYFFVSTLF